MRRGQRLKQRRDFTAVYRYGRMFRNDVLILRALATSRPDFRFGFAAGTHIGGAVMRNRTKRRLREVVRLLDIDAGWDAILTARPKAATAAFEDLRAGAEELLGRAGMLKGTTPS